MRGLDLELEEEEVTHWKQRVFIAICVLLGIFPNIVHFLASHQEMGGLPYLFLVTFVALF